jgi:DNA-binding response OmpR family regulator
VNVQPVKHRILIVANNPDIAQPLHDSFRDHGYDILTTSRGRDALDICYNEQPHLLLLDTVLPDMSGYEVCRRLRNDPHTRHLLTILLLQADESEDALRAALRATIHELAHDYVIKPFDVEELRLRVQGALTRARYTRWNGPKNGHRSD